MAKLTLSLGSNEGNRNQYLQDAREALAGRLGPVVYASDIAITPPWGPVSQGDFLNQVLVLHIDTPVRGTGIAERLHAILDITQDIERQYGRQRDQRWGPRTLDIDLVFLDDLTYEDERISLPHPWWLHRSFVRDLLPPGFVDPHGLILNQG